MSEHESQPQAGPPAGTCPVCGSPLPQGRLEGLCPACLLAQGAETTPDENLGARPFQPPSLEELVRLFPQLEIISLLGAGGMGAVYKARQPALDRFVALKILPARETGGEKFTERFNREARALARLSHPHIVAVHEFGQTGDLHYFIMEYVDGANLRQLQQAERLSPRQALQIVPQICDALQYAHDEGIVHRDIKPENVLVDRRGRVKIADFGLAKILNRDPEGMRLTGEGQVMGTPHYMAPEQLERPLSVDHRADIYSLGVVFYEMLTGDLPLGKFQPPSRKVQVDVRLDEIVLRALENDPRRRYQKASEVKQRVETVVREPTPESSSPASPKFSSSPRLLRWAGIALVEEREGERTVLFQGVLAVLALVMASTAVGFLLVRLLAGQEHVSPRLGFVAGFAAVAWILWRALKRPPLDPAPETTPTGTVILAPPSRWRLARDLVVLGVVMAFVVGWHFLKAHVINPRLASGADAIRVDQVARPDPVTGALVAALPAGGAIELWAVSDPDASPHGWWSPQGRPRPDLNLRLEKLGSVSGLSKPRQKNFILRWQDLPEGADFPRIEFDPPASHSGGGQVLVNGRPLHGGYPLRTAFPANLRHTDLRVGVAFEPWQTFTAYEPARQTYHHRGIPGFGSQPVHIHHVTEAGGHLQVTLVQAREDRNWKATLVAVDTNGVAHSHFEGAGTPTEQSETWTFTFRNLPLAAVKELQWRARPVHWIEFRAIALQPRGPVLSGSPGAAP